MKIHTWSLVHALAFCAIPSSQIFVTAQPLLLDDFSGPQSKNAGVTIISPAAPKVFDIELYDTDLPSVLGGDRSVRMGVKQNPLGSVAAVSVGEGAMSAAQGVNAKCETRIEYGRFARIPGVSGSDGRGPDLDLDLSQYSGIHLSFAGAEDGMNINVVYYTSSPLDPDDPRYYASSGINMAPSTPNDPVEVDLEFPSDLSPPFNWGSVDGILVLINGASARVSTSYTLDMVYFE